MRLFFLLFCGNFAYSSSRGPPAEKKKKPTPASRRGFPLWRAVLFYRLLRLQTSSVKIRSSTSPFLAAASFRISASLLSVFPVCSIALFPWFRKKCPTNFTNNSHILVHPVKSRFVRSTAEFSTSRCGNWRNHGETMGFHSLFPASLYIFSLAFGILLML